MEPSPPGRPPLRSFNDPISIGRTSSSSNRSSDDSPSYVSRNGVGVGVGGTASVIHSLSSILNNPSASRSDASWSLWWPSGSAAATDLAPLPAMPAGYPDISRASFLQYLSTITEPYLRFEDVQNHSSKESAEIEMRGLGEALVACLREVPSLYFKEDFTLDEGETFHAACPFSPSASANAELQERLTKYLDVVEMHLVKEISLRSDSFFEAQGQLEGLNRQIVETCARIRGLKETIRILTVDLVDSARHVQELNAAREKLVSLQQKLTVILYVNQALSALKLLVGAADCAGALDVCDDLRHLLDTDELAGLHCFRHLREQLASSLDSVNSILSAEFLRATIRSGRTAESAIVSKSKDRNSNAINGRSIEDEMEEEKSALQDHLLPLIIGLLRTAKLPAILRLYRDKIVADMKASVKTRVAELVPVLLNKSLDSDIVTAERAVDPDGGGPSLASKLRSLSTESFVELLSAIFKVVEAHLLRAAEVKRLIEWIMGNIEGCFTADAVPGTAVVVDNVIKNDGSHTLHPLPRNAAKISILQGKVNESSSPSTSKNFRADILRENAEAVFAACDTAHGRWAKLLVVRAHIHPKIRLQEFLCISNITQDFISSTEKIGGRLGYSIRGTLQSQSKAFIDYQHDSRMAKIKAVLDQETWVTVDVPDEFQSIVRLLSSFSSPSINIELEDNHKSVLVELVSSDHTVISNRSGWPAANHTGNASALAQENESSPLISRQSEDGNLKDHVKSASQTLMLRGVGYHMVNCGLILLKMIAEYVDMSGSLTQLASEVVHRIVEILKFFNTRTCQLVLGAGAMQVSGLKSITAKHLALASQIITFIYFLIPDIQQVLFLKIPESRKVLLLSEMDRLAQDYKVHRDEIHTKLVQIMRERLLSNVRNLSQNADTWNEPEDIEIQPSKFARAVTKEVTFLHRVLSQTLLETEVQAIFRQVLEFFHSYLSEAFSNIEIKTPRAKKGLLCDAQHILGCIHKLPSYVASRDGINNYGLLDEFLADYLEQK